MWRKPVGEGAKRVMMGSVIYLVGSNDEIWRGYSRNHPQRKLEIDKRRPADCVPRHARCGLSGADQGAGGATNCFAATSSNDLISNPRTSRKSMCCVGL